jgi:LacI family transcriptional regulator
MVRTGVSRVGIKDVALRAGVSVGTVSNVLNRPETVADATRARVLDAIRELGFVRNESARELRAGRSRTLGLLVTDLGNPFFADVARGVEAIADAHDAIVTLYDSGGDLERERRHLGQLEEQRALGVLLAPVDSAAMTLQPLTGRGTPVVLMAAMDGRHDGCFVAVDDALGGAIAAEHLIEQGHRRMAFVGNASLAAPVGRRFRGMRDAVAAAGLPAPTLFETTRLGVADGRDAGAQIAALPARRRPTAVFCGNDVVALGALRALSNAGLAVPGDVAIVGCDDIRFAAAAAVPLSSLRLPRERLGRTAAELLFEEIDDATDHCHRHVVFRPELVIRESSLATARNRADGDPAARAVSA